jgi:hypothetical protein
MYSVVEMTWRMDIEISKAGLRRIHAGLLEDSRSLDGVAGTIGKLAVKVLTVESALEAVTQRALTLERDLLIRQDQACISKDAPKPAVSVEIHGHDVVYWNQVATTLYNEAIEARKEAEIRAESYRVLQDNHIRLATAHRQMVDECAVLNRDIAVFRMESGPNDPSVVAGVDKKIPLSVPVNPQGKDVVFWHQCARTLQQQCLDVNKQLDDKTSQHAAVVETLKLAEVTCKEKDVTISGLEDHVKKLLEHRSILENQLRKLFK